MIRHTTTPFSSAQKLLAASRCLRDPSSSRSVSTTPLRAWDAERVRGSTKDGNSEYYKKRLSARDTSPEGIPPKARSRHLQNDGSQPVIRNPKYYGRLRPADVSKRIHRFCAGGRFPDAVEMVKNLPADAQNTVVWNTLIDKAFENKRYNVAYKLFTDMKRRGFRPDIRTFYTMFGGYMSVKDWSRYTLQLQNVHSLFEEYQVYIEETRQHSPHGGHISVAPINAYIMILSNVGDYQKMMDVYSEMEEAGPLAPNHYTFANLFNAIAEKKRTSSAPEDVRAQRAKNASEVKLLWRQMIRVSESNPAFEIDSHVIEGALKALKLGSPTDHLFAFDIIREYLGLAKFGEAPVPVKVEMTPHVFVQALSLCNTSGKYRLAPHFFRQVADRQRRGEEPVIGRSHVEKVIEAHAGLGMTINGESSIRALEVLEWLLKESALQPDSERLRPKLKTFTLVLATCWRDGDWTTATRTFELMTGYDAEDFADEGEVSRNETLRPQERSEGRIFEPDTAAMSHIVRTALASGDARNMRQCLRIVDYFKPDRFLGHRHPEEEHEPQDQNHDFYAAKLVKDLLEITDTVVPKGNKSDRSDEEQRWQEIRKLAESYTFPPSSNAPQVPFYERNPLGSERSLAAIDHQVKQDMDSRRMLIRKSSR
ncbi:uncharacterized protein LAESUDRAFT_753819 [Laetiporus sulphureus 93-53]|uniref:Pentacotripeptide-repeat region of PRORP domain-containing protein n=1 Tax=Laetiporus sulphureus 93-53 TaxID=1314785 RepID=A0A165I9P5_9APHY|nr:uncharacterized protein LAESUDRAFT_753819 [Laetiporus sulphureus 93-53]KZT12775.1 hypothetical protein LAESUDRAFT_753819 [Laetiporus sulphureus 93-53]